MKTDEEISVRWLLTSLARGIIETLRRNKLAAVLAAVTLAVLIGFTAVTSSAGLDHYRQSILPRLVRLEIGFYASLSSAEKNSDAWRAYYFENAHSQVRDILRAARLARPQAYAARRKHREFIRYYELIELEFHTLSQQASMNPSLDYVGQLKTGLERLRPIRDEWAEWAGKPGTEQQ